MLNTSSLDKLKLIKKRNRLILISFATLTLGALSSTVSAESRLDDFQRIQGLFEPSGVVQLNDGRLLTVEDEPNDPFVILAQNSQNSSFSINHLRVNSIIHPSFRHISDLEGVAKDHNGQIYAITSQSRKSNGKRDSKREKFIRFTIKGDRLLTSNVRNEFRNELIDAFPALEKSARERNVKDALGLNIEGLTFSPDGNILWVGLRAPLFNQKALLIGVKNSRDALEFGDTFQFSDAPVALDLDGGGIRDITYDPTLSGYLILSQRENSKKQHAFKLWLWDGNAKAAPRRIRITGIKKLDRTEGIAPVRLNGKNWLILFNDDGNRRKNMPASYHLVDYAQLDIEVVQ